MFDSFSITRLGDSIPMIDR